MGIKGIVFDLDGVLISTDEFHYLAWKGIADNEGIYFDRKINHRLRGVSRMGSLEIILERANRVYGEDEKVALTEIKNANYRKLLETLTPADCKKSVTDTLDYLRKNGYKLAVGSSSKNAPFILEKIGLGNFFDAVIDGSKITKSKPDPEVFLKAAAAIGLKPENCFVVEDSRVGIDAAISGGFKSIAIGDAVNYGKADFNISDISEITAVCEKVNA